MSNGRNNEAIDKVKWLGKLALRPHMVRYVTAGASHGDPGGYEVIAEHCPRVKTGIGCVEGEDETKNCTCGAESHNAKVDQSVRLILKCLFNTTT